MNVAILYPTVSTGPDGISRDDRDTLEQVVLVRDALNRLGHRTSEFHCTLDLSALADWLRRERPDCCFNLVETLDGSGRLIHIVPALLEHLSVPYTSAGSSALAITTGKVLAKEYLAAYGISTPAWFHGGRFGGGGFRPGKWILKPVSEDGSLGIDDGSVVDVTALDEIVRLTADHETKIGRECFAERFIDGREFNLSLLGSENGMEVLPPAEILFRGYPDGKPRIVGWEAKWKEGSFEFDNTPRSFDFPVSDTPLLEALRRTSLAVRDAFRLRGYARVDFRVDYGVPSVIEVNINPCINVGAGFLAAAERAGLRFEDVVARILADV
jgi:D-alanine-D-alanine ligase